LSAAAIYEKEGLWWLTIVCGGVQCAGEVW